MPRGGVYFPRGRCAAAIFGDTGMRQRISELSALTAFNGSFPTVPTYDWIDVDALIEGDSDPMYVTLEIAQRGRVSANGLIYDDQLVNAIEAQLAEADSWRGHLGFFSQDEYPTSEIYWVGHMRVGDSTWAKGYVPPGETRTDMRRKKAKGQKVGTSITAYGEFEWADESQERFYLREVELISVDLVHAKRAAHQTSQQFALTRESIQNEQREKEADMPTREEILRSLTVADLPQALRESIQNEATQTLQTEMGQLRTQLQETETALATANGLVTQLQQAAFESAMSEAVATCTANWNVTTESGKARVAQLHAMIRNAATLKLAGANDPAKVGEAVKAAWEDHKLIAESVQLALSGPAAVVPAKTTTTSEANGLSAYKTDEGRAALLAKFDLS